MEVGLAEAHREDGDRLRLARIQDFEVRLHCMCGDGAVYERRLRDRRNILRRCAANDVLQRSNKARLVQVDVVLQPDQRVVVVRRELVDKRAEGSVRPRGYPIHLRVAPLDRERRFDSGSILSRQREGFKRFLDSGQQPALVDEYLSRLECG